jgi:hypothetical protein
MIDKILDFITSLLKEIDAAPETMYRKGMEDGLQRVAEFIEDERDD